MTDSFNNDRFINLDRTFRELPKSASQSDEADLERFYPIGKRVRWPEILQEYRVILLAEAGAGKTEEIRNSAGSLRKQGFAAFFMRLENILGNFEESFEVGSVEGFNDWLTSNNEGWLFLDSVDEARLKDPGDFALAVKRLARLIATAKDRSHIIITGRVNAWRPKTDLALCVSQFPLPIKSTVEKRQSSTTSHDRVETEETVGGSETAAPSFKIMTLDDLSSEQIEAFAKEKGIEDARLFLEAVERADAWSFTSRPQDLMELIEFWTDEGRIGGRLELMRNSIQRRLEERDQQRADARPLAPSKALDGARMIAAATTLGQSATIRVPDGADNAKGVALQAILPDWDDRDRLTLLSRPIFDEAIYGTVRFHHRSVREYLAAEWFVLLLARETSRRRIESLFFVNQYGIDVIVPGLRPILPWLAILDAGIRDRVRKTAPEVIFEGGDPSHLPLDTRRHVLHEVCEQLAGGSSGRSMTDYAAVQRFANTDLTEDIRSLLHRYADNQEVVSFLLRMVWIGQTSGALPEAKQVALSPLSARYCRIAAFRAVQAIGSTGDNHDVRRSFSAEAAELDRQWLAELLKDAPPNQEAVEWLLDCLSRVKPERAYSVDELPDIVKAFVNRLDLGLIRQLVEGFDALLQRPPMVERHYCQVSKSFKWLIAPAAEAVKKLILARSAVALERASLGILNKLTVAGSYLSESDVRLDKAAFGALVSGWKELNHRLFWYAVDAARVHLDSRNGERLTDYWSVFYLGPLWEFSESDFDYLCTEVRDRLLVDDKLVALSLAFRIYVASGRPSAWRKSLKKACNNNEELLGRLGSLLKPPKTSKETASWKRQEAQLRRRSEARDKALQKNREEWREFLRERVSGLRDNGLGPGQFTNAQRYLHDQMRGNGFRSGRWTQGNWQELIKEHGEEVARAFRDGVVGFWRGYSPVTRSEGAPDNSTPMAVVFGLTGLEIEARETADWASTLSPVEVKLACRYAALELNGFPTWFPRLFEVHTETVADFLLNEIEFELATCNSDQDMNYILSDVVWSGQWSWEALGAPALKLLETHNPANAGVLNKLLTIVQGSKVPDCDLAELAAAKINKELPPEHVAQWYAAWVGVAPEIAVSTLERHFAHLRDADQQTLFAMQFITRLSGERREPTSTRHYYQTPSVLKSLYLLMQRYIRSEEDIDRAGTGVYSPGLRDGAQEARDGLFNILTKMPGKDAFLALQSIARSHPRISSRPWLMHLAKDRAAQDAEMHPWSPVQVREFYQQLERTPGNHKELADLAVLRLLDLKDDLENGDSSVASVIKSGASQETEMRKYIGHELREKAAGRYHVPQEEELADAKKPDLRFHGMGFDGPVPAELKLADKWTGPDLFERLENQLCGDYLRDRRSARGIFVLVHNGSKHGWDIPGASNRVDFDGLVQSLQAQWELISEKFVGIDDISVIGIDLTARSQSRTRVKRAEHPAAHPQ